MRFSREFLFRLFYFAIVAAFWLGCAGSGRSSVDQPHIAADSKTKLFVSLLALPDTVDSALTHLGWGAGRFAQELRKEISYQLNRKGVATVEDSAVAQGFLTLSISEYAEGGGSPSRFSCEAQLRTAAGERRFTCAKSSKRAESLERSDPTVDNIRLIAQSVVTEACKTTEKKRKGNEDFNPPILMIF